MYKILTFFSRMDIIAGTISVFIVPFMFFKLGHILKSIYNPQSRNKNDLVVTKVIPTSHLLSENICVLKKMLGSSSDIIIRDLTIHSLNKSATIVYIDGLVDTVPIHDHLLFPLVNHQLKSELEKECLICYGPKKLLTKYIISIGSLTETVNIEDAMHQVLTGCVILLVDDLKEILVMDVEGLKTRTIEEPITEGLVRGPRVRFLENIRDNTAILRRLTTDNHLTFCDYDVGKRTKRKLVVTYIDGIPNEQLIQEVKKRIEQINLEDVPESGYIEQLIEDDYLSPFPQVQSTERPDRVMAALLGGRIGILLDGTPFVLIVPVTFSMTTTVTRGLL